MHGMYKASLIKEYIVKSVSNLFSSNCQNKVGLQNLFSYMEILCMKLLDVIDFLGCSSSFPHRPVNDRAATTSLWGGCPQ